MAGSSLLALIDDIATLLDDVSVMTKVATQKTAGVLGDDLALNAQQVAGVAADRELPVVWAVAKGSTVNKMILVPAALAISALEFWLHSKGINIPLITPLMMVGGAFLCFEGVEKIAHKFLHDDAEDEKHHKDMLKALVNDADLVAFEKVGRSLQRCAAVVGMATLIVASRSMLNIYSNKPEEMKGIPSHNM